MRLFIAIPIPSSGMASRLSAHFRGMLARESIVWTKPENYHLTLLFLGDIPEKYVSDILELMGAVAYDVDPFTLRVEKVGLFGSRYAPRVIWVGAQPTEILTTLHERLSKVMEEVGYVADRQNFVPHLTLGRIKKVADKKQLQRVLESQREALLYSGKVEEIVLYESVLSREGPIYTVKGVSPLGC
ncbi:MAG: RNA 2',3'-cyclic phosphodiesterase [Bacteroidetes bacterium]|nr:MAG: RNA 2',3'-cyclic phosphodiesterase [Bacteroidota bacterium]